MNNLNNSAFPDTLRANPQYIPLDKNDRGLTELKYTAIKIFCASLTNHDLAHFGIDVVIDKSIEYAKILLQKCEDK